jgi:hypothetical protein
MRSHPDIYSKVRALIKVKSNDTLVDHVKLIFSDGESENIHGFLKDDGARLWIASNSVIGIAYPVIRLSIDKEGRKVSMSSKMNSFGLMVAIILNFFIIPATVGMFLFRSGESPNFSFVRLLGCILFVGVFNSPFIFSYRVARDVLSNHIDSALKS